MPETTNFKFYFMKDEERNKLIRETLERGVTAIYPSREFLEDRLKSGEKLVIYHGIDPTGPTLHLGHAIQLRKLSEFQKLGHQIVLLIGDFTATIGDPSGKLSSRKMLSPEEVLENSVKYKKQAGFWLSFSGPNKAIVKYNSKWLGKMSLRDFIPLASKITVEQLLERDMFKKRKEEGKPVFLHEFFYPLLQGYDSVALSVDGELGGSDQIFNMLVGRDLAKTLSGKEKFVIATKLLEDSDGRKMGKTEGNMVALDSSAEEMFGKVMSWTDNLILPGLELCTELTSEKIKEIADSLSAGMNPRDAKLILAGEVVAIYHDRKKAETARKNFIRVFSEGGQADAKEIVSKIGSDLSEVLVSFGVVSSKSEYRRLVAEGAVRNMMTGEKINDPAMKIDGEISLKIGKHRFVKIKLG